MDKKGRASATRTQSKEEMEEHSSGHGRVRNSKEYDKKGNNTEQSVERGEM